MKINFFIVIILFGIILFSGCTTSNQNHSYSNNTTQENPFTSNNSLPENDNSKNLIDKANTFLKSGNFIEANEIYQSLINENCTDSKVLFNYGVGLLEDQKYPEAIELFEHAEKLKLDDKDPYWYNKGITKLGLSDYKNADLYFSMIDKSDALYPKSLILSAIAHNKIGKSDGNKIMEQATNYDTTKKIALENLELLKLEEDCELSIPSFVKDNTGILTKEGNEQIISDLQELVTQYYQTHEYSKDDFFVCTDMALDLWNQCKAKNIKAYIVIGSLDKRYPNENEFNHAWVVTEPVPEKFVAMDATAGIINLENERYYFGYYFENPKNLKNYQDFSKDYENQVLIVDNIVSRYNGQYSKYVNALNQLNYDANHYNKKYAGKILNAFDYENSVDLLTNIEVGRVKVDAMASELNSLLNQVDNEKNTLNELFLKIYNLPTFIKAAKKEFQTCPPAILD